MCIKIDSACKRGGHMGGCLHKCVVAVGTCICSRYVYVRAHTFHGKEGPSGLLLVADPIYLTQIGILLPGRQRGIKPYTEEFISEADACVTSSGSRISIASLSLSLNSPGHNSLLLSA